MHIDRPELENETGGDEEEPDEAGQNVKGCGSPALRK